MIEGVSYSEKLIKQKKWRNWFGVDSLDLRGLGPRVNLKSAQRENAAGNMKATNGG